MKLSLFVTTLALLALSQANATQKMCPPGDTAICQDQDKLVISGRIIPFCDIKVNADAAATNLNISSGETAKKVASVTESTNSPNGYTVHVASANSGKLVNGTSQVPYQLSYNSGAFFSPLATNTLVKTKAGPLTSTVTEVSDVKVSFAASSGSAGLYSDTLTFTLTGL